MGEQNPSPRVAFEHADLDATERLFWGDVWAATPAKVAAERGLAAESFGPILALRAAGLREVPMLNLVLGAGATGATAGGDLAAAVEWLDSLGGRYYVPLHPGDPGAGEAEAWLRDNGFGKGYGWMKFVRDAAPPEMAGRPGVDVVEVGAGERADFGRIVATGFGLPEWGAALFSELPGRPGWRCYTAHVDGAPQGAAAMRIDDDVAEFGAAATLEAARGRGCQTQLLRRRILDAAEAGCRLLFVETGERVPGKPDASYRNILRAGFEEAYLRPNWRRE
jgi:GNAT superfamily N-acetyltransferase